MPERRKIKKITIEIDGKPDRVYDIAGGDELPMAIFFTSTAVHKMLSPFYKDLNTHLIRADVEKPEIWGKKIADKVFGTGTEPSKKITESVIYDAWSTPDEDGKYLAMVVKKPYCPLE
jgi:hypothetical protein